MTSTVEKVARAICEEEQGHTDFWNVHKDMYLKMAQAALTALEEEGMVVVPREPTVAMLEAATDADLTEWSDETPIDFPAKCHAKIWQAMAKAAPKDPSP